MEIGTRRVGKCIVLDCGGLLIYDTAAETLRKAIHEAVQDGALKIVLNLSDVPDADNRGVAEIVSGFAYVKKRGGSLPLLNLDPKLHKRLVIMKLATVFDIYDDEQKALEGCE